MTPLATTSDAGPPGSVDEAPDRGREVRCRRRSALTPPLVMLAVIGLVAAFTTPLQARLGTVTACYAIAGIGLSVLAGTTRIVNLGVSAFFGLGAFVTAGVLSTLELPIALALAAIACMVLGLVVAPVAGRLTGIFMAIVTVGLALLGQHIFRISTAWTGGTAGRTVDPPVMAGLQVTRDLTVGGAALDGQVVYFVVCATILVLTALATTNLLRARAGRALSTLAASPVAARSFGISPVRYRSVAFVYSSALTGIAGGLLAGQSGFISYEQFNVDLSIELLAVVVLGGLGSVYGVVVAAAILVLLPEVVMASSGALPFIAAGGGTEGITAEQFSAVLYGLALVIVMVIEPRGLSGLWQRARTSRSRRDDRN